MAGLRKSAAAFFTVTTLVLLVLTALAATAGASTPERYYFPSASSGDQVNISNIGTVPASIEMYTLDGNHLGSQFQLPGDLKTSGVTTDQPLELLSTSGQPFLVSKESSEGLHQYSDFYATPAGQLDDHYYFSWYDGVPGRFVSKINIANPQEHALDYEIIIDGQSRGSGAISAGEGVRVEFPGLIGGPVEVKTHASDDTDKPAEVVCSQTVLYSDGEYVTEIPGYAANRLSHHYYWAEYDSRTANSWIIVSNINAFPIYYEIIVGGYLAASNTLASGQFHAGSYYDVQSGPVEVRTWTDASRTTPAESFATVRRITAKPNSSDQIDFFSETLGTPVSELSPVAYINKIDERYRLSIANAGVADTTVDVTVVGSGGPDYSGLQLPAGEVLRLEDMSGGPVIISSTGGQPILVEKIWLNKSFDYYFPWYDSLYGQTWIVMAEPSGGSSNAFDVFFKPYDQQSQVQMNTSGPITVDPGGQPGVIIEPGAMGGPVKVQASGTGLVSERSLFGNSFEEVWATYAEDMDNRYWWPWYDNYTPGMSNWIMVSNPPDNPYSVSARVIIHIPQEYGGNIVLDSNGPIQPGGDAWTPQFPGVMAGPVEVWAWRYGTTCCNNPENVVASQRVLYNGAFNEMPGIPASKLDDTYFWTWYDNFSPGSANAIAVSNPNGQTVYVAAGIGLDESDGGFEMGDFESFAPYETASYQAPGVMDGPVTVVGCYNPSNCENTPAPIVATQQILWGPSYGEIAGIPESQMNESNANWTWYDQQSPGAANWVMVSNLNNYSIWVEIKIAGVVRWSGTLAQLDRITPAFPGVMGGPVEVNAWTDSGKTTPAPVFASQRVLWNGYFNEIVGKGL